jgi:hypothetical protein
MNGIYVQMSFPDQMKSRVLLETAYAQDARIPGSRMNIIRAKTLAAPASCYRTKPVFIPYLNHHLCVHSEPNKRILEPRNC